MVVDGRYLDVLDPGCSYSVRKMVFSYARVSQLYIQIGSKKHCFEVEKCEW